MGNILKKKIWYDKQGKGHIEFADSMYPDKRFINERKCFIDNIDTYKMIKKQMSEQVLNNYKYNTKTEKLDCNGKGIYIDNNRAMFGIDKAKIEFENLNGYLIGSFNWWDDREEIEALGTIKGLISTYSEKKYSIRPLQYIRIINSDRFEEYFKITSCIRIKNTSIYFVKNIDELGSEDQEDISLFNVARVNSIKSNRILVKLEGISSEDIKRLEFVNVECNKLTISYYLQYREVYIDNLKVKEGSVDEIEVNNTSEEEYYIGANTNKLTINKFEEKVVGTLKLIGIRNFEIKDFQGVRLEIEWTMQDRKKISKVDIEKIKEIKAKIRIKTETGNKRIIKLAITFDDIYKYWDTNLYKIKVGDKKDQEYYKEGDIQKGIKKLMKEYIEIVNETNDEVQFLINYKDKVVGGTKDWSDLVRNVKK